jgi:hypothetical protein
MPNILDLIENLGRESLDEMLGAIQVLNDLVSEIVETAGEGLVWTGEEAQDLARRIDSLVDVLGGLRQKLQG